MLGLRLDGALEERLAKFAGDMRRTRSDVVRDALDEYLTRYSLGNEFKRQLALIRAETSNAELEAVDARSADLMQLINAREDQTGNRAG